MHVAGGSKSNWTWMEVLRRRPAGVGCQFSDIQLERGEEEKRLPGDRQMKRAPLREKATASCLQRVKRARSRRLTGHRDRGVLMCVL